MIQNCVTLQILFLNWAVGYLFVCKTKNQLSRFTILKNIGPTIGTQKSVHLSLLRFKTYFVHLDDRLNPLQHGGCQCCTHFWRAVLSFFWDNSFFNCSLLEGLFCSTFLFKILQLGFKSFDIHGQLFSSFETPFASVLWIVIMLEYSSSAKLLETGSHLVIGW